MGCSRNGAKATAIRNRLRIPRDEVSICQIRNLQSRESGRSTRPQINEPIDAADQPAATNDIADGDGDKTGEEYRPRQGPVVGGV